MAATATARTDGLYPTELLQTLLAFRKGDFSVRMPIEYTGVPGKIADTLNEIIDLKQRLVREGG